MSRRTHAAAGLLIGFSLGAYSTTPFPETILLALVGQAAAVLPDVDLKLGLKHRGITHSLLALLIVALIGLYADFRFQHSAFCMSFVLGYASHLVLDLLTMQGIELFYPNHRRIRVLKLRTSSRIDYLIGAGMLCGALRVFVGQLL